MNKRKRKVYKNVDEGKKSTFYADSNSGRWKILARDLAEAKTLAKVVFATNVRSSL